MAVYNLSAENELHNGSETRSLLMKKTTIHYASIMKT